MYILQKNVNKKTFDPSKISCDTDNWSNARWKFLNCKIHSILNCTNISQYNNIRFYNIFWASDLFQFKNLSNLKENKVYENSTFILHTSIYKGRKIYEADKIQSYWWILISAFSHWFTQDTHSQDNIKSLMRCLQCDKRAGPGPIGFWSV